MCRDRIPLCELYYSRLILSHVTSVCLFEPWGPTSEPQVSPEGPQLLRSLPPPPVVPPLQGFLGQIVTQRPLSTSRGGVSVWTRVDGTVVVHSHRILGFPEATPCRLTRVRNGPKDPVDSSEGDRDQVCGTLTTLSTVPLPPPRHVGWSTPGRGSDWRFVLGCRDPVFGARGCEVIIDSKTRQLVVPRNRRRDLPKDHVDSRDIH